MFITEHLKNLVTSLSSISTDDAVTAVGGGAGLVVSQTTDPVFHILGMTLKYSTITSSLWTIFNMVVGGLLLFYLKKLSEYFFNKLKQKKIKNDDNEL
jgi:hypothetical protein